MKKYIILTAILLFPFILSAQQSVFEYVEGEVSIKRISGDLFEAQIGDTLNPGDSVITGFDGFAELTLENSSKITIDSDTVFVFSQKEQKGEKKSIFMVVLGKIGFKFDKLLNEPDISTPATVAGIRGTEFTVVSAMDGSAMYIVDDGSVAVESEGSMVVLETLEGVEVPIGEEPGEKFEVLLGQVDYSQWLNEGQSRFESDPAGTLAGLTSKLQEYVEEADGFYGSYLQANAELTAMREKLSAIGEEKGDEAKSEYYKSTVFPKEMDTSNFVLNYRYFALSSLSLRRYVIGSMYVDMKTKFILDKDNPLFRNFVKEYESFLMIFENKVVPYLVEADI